mgnify:FL=1
MTKNKRYVRICAALLCAVLCLSVNVAPAMAAKVTQADIDALKGNAASLDKKQKEIQSKLNSLKNDKAAAVQKKTLLDDQIANTNAKISNTEAQISDYNALISQAEIELADAQQREEAQYELFCKRVREMEERGTISYWSVLFKANSFSDLLGSLDFINEVMDYDRRVIQDLQTLQAEIAEKKAGLEANKAALEAAKELQLATILTSGQAASAPQGASLLHQLVQAAGNDIEILVGAGVGPANLPDLAAQTGAKAFHLSGKKVLDSRMIFRREGVPMGLPGFSEFDIWQTDEATIREVRTILDTIA